MVVAAGCGGTDGVLGSDAAAHVDALVGDAPPAVDAAVSDVQVDVGTIDVAPIVDVLSDVAADGSDAGVAPRLHAGHSIVAAGSLLRSTRFEMVSTLGGPSVQQTNLRSPNFRLRGGLTGIIGSR